MQKTNLTILDADSLCWILSYKFRNKETLSKLNLSEVNLFVKDILSTTKADFYIGFVGGEGKNFRKYLDPQYKGNRPELPEFFVKHGPTIKQILLDIWKFIPTSHIEADDACSICANELKDKYNITVASPDKDLRQISDVTIYNYDKHTSEVITKLEGIKSLATLLLMGDTSDNIKGIPGVGKVGANKILVKCSTVNGVKFAVARQYFKSLGAQGAISRQEKSDIKNQIESIEGLSKKQKERKIRIKLNELLAEKKEKSPWRKYMKLQILLASTLIRPRFGFIVPEVTPANINQKVIQKEESDMLDGI